MSFNLPAKFKIEANLCTLLTVFGKLIRSCWIKQEKAFVKIGRLRSIYSWSRIQTKFDRVECWHADHWTTTSTAPILLLLLQPIPRVSEWLTSSSKFLQFHFLHLPPVMFHLTNADSRKNHYHTDFDGFYSLSLELQTFIRYVWLSLVLAH